MQSTPIEASPSEPIVFSHFFWKLFFYFKRFSDIFKYCSNFPGSYGRSGPPFKEHLAGENFFQSSETGQELSIEETGRVAGTLFAHDSFNYFNNQIPNYPQLSEELRSISSHPEFALPSGATDDPVGFGHNEIDWRFSSNCGPMFSDPSREVNIDALSYQMRGEAASFYGYHNPAIDNFSKAIEMNPTDSMLYFQKGSSLAYLIKNIK